MLVATFSPVPRDRSDHACSIRCDATSDLSEGHNAKVTTRCPVDGPWVCPCSPLPGLSDGPKSKLASPQLDEKTWLDVCVEKQIARFAPGLVSTSFWCHSMRR